MAEPEEKSLKRADGDIAPQGYDEAKENWDFIQLRDGRQLVRDDKVEKKLEEVIEALQGDSDDDELQSTRVVNDEGTELFTEDDPAKVEDDSVEKRLSKIEDKLDSVIDDDAVNAQLTGSIVEYEVATDFSVPEDDKKEFRVKVTDAFGNIPEYWGYMLHLDGNTNGNPSVEIRQGTGDNSAIGEARIHEQEFSKYQSVPPSVEVDGHHPFAVNIYVKNDDKDNEMDISYLKLWAYVRG